MTTPRALDTTAAGLQRLYYRIVLYSVAAVVILDTASDILLGAGFRMHPVEMALTGAVLLFAWFGGELVDDASGGRREPKGVFLGLTGFLLVALSMETGGLSSPYYMLLVATCIFGALVMRPGRAFPLAVLLGITYCMATWLHPHRDHLFHEGLPGVLSALHKGMTSNTQHLSALVVHMGFLYVGVWISSRLSVGFRQKLSSLETTAVKDPLTGLPNRRGFMEKLDQQMVRAVHWDWPVGIFVADLDHFKRVNDKYGHPLGDQVLASAARLLREAAGPLDNLARIGGEEFAIAAVGADRNHAADLADRIIRSFRTYDWDAVHPGLSITISLGVAVLQPGREGGPIDDLSALIDVADRALLQVKQHGRNGYLIAGAETVTPPKRTVAAPTQP